MTSSSPSSRRSAKCAAKNPATCRVHGTRKPLSPAQWLDQPEHRSPQARSILTDPAPLAAALDSSLTWEGQKPDWWESYSAELQNLERLPSTPELLDIIDTPAGELAVVWTEHSPFDRDQDMYDSGMALNFIGLYNPKTKEYAGYLKAGLMNEDTLNASYGEDELRTFRYLERYGSFHVNIPTPQEWAEASEEEQVAALRKLWPKMMREAARNEVEVKVVEDGKPVALYNLEEKHAPDTLPALLHDLRRAERPFKKQLEGRQHLHAVPHVDFSRAEEPLKGKGYGAALYVYMGRQLAKKNLVLRGSTSQTGDAQGMWNRLQGRFQEKVGVVRLRNPYTHKYDTHPVLDFR